MLTIQDRVQGCLLGLAIGDAVGTTVEFKPRGSFPDVTDMTGGGPFSLNAGEWTDDTSMALCLASSLIENGFDLKDQIEKYIRWMKQGYMSSNGKCFDIGITVSTALLNFEKTGNPESGPESPNSAGNGCIMRLAPIPIYYWDKPDLATKFAIEQSKTTHRAPECLAASRLFGEMIVRALNGKTTKKEVLISDNISWLFPISERLLSIAKGEYFDFESRWIRGNGYVVDSLEASLWSFYTTNSFEEAILKAVNLGGDADTTAAICGQIAGGYYGISGIPEKWKNKIVMGKQICEMADALILKKQNHKKRESIEEKKGLLESFFFS